MSHDPASADESKLDELVAEYLERAEVEPTRAQSMLEELCRANSDIAGELRRRVTMLVKSGLWKPVEGGGSDVPERLGDYKLLRRLGGGGMGVVFLAEQESVGRRVALKLIRSEQLFFHGARLRFLREAQAVARMDHPNIVQVLTVGEEAGVPYIAMEYVAGCPLDLFIAKLRPRDPSTLSGRDAREVVAAQLVASANSDIVEWNEAFFERGWVELCLRIAREIAHALHHAHQRGVLHRDVKPSNVLLSPTGRVRLLDFGLASLSNAAAITRSGTQLGSLPYMAPEQVEGQTDRIGPATDVYAVGLLLRELLTLRAAYSGANELALRKAVLDAQPTPIRALNPSVPADVETVCAKAIESDLARRYATAAEFERDLGNLLELRPIEARPPSRLHCVVRWTQRRPAVATACVLGLFVLVAGPLGWELNRMNTLEQVSASLASERTAHEAAERSFQAALQAVGHVLRDTATEDLEDVPRMQQARLVAIDKALELFPALERDRGDDPLVLAQRADLHQARGDVLNDLGRREESLAQFKLAVDCQRRVLAHDDTPERKTFLSAVLTQCGKSLSAMLRSAEGLPMLDEAVALMRAASDAEPARRDWRRKLAAAQLASGEARILLGLGTTAAPAIAEARQIAEQLSASDATSCDDAWTLGRALGWSAELAEHGGQPGERLDCASRSLAAFERARDLAPGRRYYAFDVAEAHYAVAGASLESRDFERCEQHLKLAGDTLDELLRDFPDSVRYRNLASDVHERLAVSYGRRGRDPEAAEIMRSIVDERERMVAAAPERCDFAVRCAMANVNLAATQLAQDKELELVLTLLDRAEQHFAICDRQHIENPDAEAMRWMIGYSRALALLHLDRLAAARPAIDLYERGAGADPLRLRYSADLWNEYLLGLQRQSGAATDQSDAKSRTLALLGRAIDAGYADARELKSNPALAPFRDDPEFAALLARFDAGK